LRRRNWLDKARNTRTGLFLKYHGAAGLTDDLAFKERVVAAATYPHSHLILGCEKNIGVDTRGYRVAAFLLVRVLASGPDGSLNEAIEAFITGGGCRASVPGASEKTIRRCWKKFGPVAHLAAAFIYGRGHLWCDVASIGLLTSFSPVGAGLALAWAECARIAGEQHQSQHAGEPLLDAEWTWKVPTSLRLPRLSLELPPPEEVTFTP
jgi:hypothetical protein